MIKDKSLHSKDKELAVGALFAHKRTFVHSTKHTQAIRELCVKIPLLSPAIRILKLWVSSHLLGSHFSEEFLELIAVHTFTFPYPNRLPGSLRSAFLRSLALIAKWDWQNEPLIVNFAEKGLSGRDVDIIVSTFREWRKIDPAMHRMTLFAASSIEHDGTAWTSPKPSLVAINRLVALADAAGKEVASQGLSIEAEPLFARSLREYDFIIHLRRTQSDTSGLGLPMANSTPDGQAVHAFIKELERVFSDHICFFHDWEARPVVGGVWLPQLDTRKWKVGSSWGSIPGKRESGRDTEVTLNKSGIIQQLAMLGADLVSRIARHDTD
jgi:U3 small nucleolar RNA-associated protein 22